MSTVKTHDDVECAPSRHHDMLFFFHDETVMAFKFGCYTTNTIKLIFVSHFNFHECAYTYSARLHIDTVLGISAHIQRLVAYRCLLA